MKNLTVSIDKSVFDMIESIRISPPRSFWCPEHGARDRNGVNKDGRGGYVCLICNKPITKIVELEGRTE